MIELIFLVETRASNKSDWMYVKSTLDFYYEQRTYGISKIFTKTKSQLIDQNENIKIKISNSSRTPKVIIVADYDRDENLNDKIIDYCKDNDYDLVWMNLDIEDVYLGKQIPSNIKGKEAINFQTKKDKLFPLITTLNNQFPLQKRHTSNILCILDKYLIRKK